MTDAPKRGGARRGAGRPPLDPADVRSATTLHRWTPAERAELDAWVSRTGRPLAELVRKAALRAARRVT